jgi:pimeloyl-ACP methyl ester carboxylesterase
VLARVAADQQVVAYARHDDEVPPEKAAEGMTAVRVGRAGAGRGRRRPACPVDAAVELSRLGRGRPVMDRRLREPVAGAAVVRRWAATSAVANARGGRAGPYDLVSARRDEPNDGKALIIVVVVVAALTVVVRILQPRLAFSPPPVRTQRRPGWGFPFRPRRSAPRTASTCTGGSSRSSAHVVYFHGNGGNLSAWLPVLAGIHQAGYSIAAIDYRGYGISTGSPSERGLYRDVEAALDWALALRPPDVPLVFWGRSLGTTMAAYAATRARPQVLILESGFPAVRSAIQGSWLLRFLSLFSSYRFPTAEYARQAACPVLVMHGDADRVIPFANGRALYEALAEPKRGGSSPKPETPWLISSS